MNCMIPGDILHVCFNRGDDTEVILEDFYMLFIAYDTLNDYGIWAYDFDYQSKQLINCSGFEIKVVK